LGLPHTPPLHWPVQQSDARLHVAPSALHWAPHLPALQVWLQHSPKPTQACPSCLHGGWQMPFEQVLLQQSVACAHIPPSGVHGPQGSPQTEPTSFTQIWSQLFMQQKGSAWQIWALHGLHCCVRAAPTTH
jgi:hypothetical protein